VTVGTGSRFAFWAGPVRQFLSTLVIALIVGFVVDFLTGRAVLEWLRGNVLTLAALVPLGVGLLAGGLIVASRRRPTAPPVAPPAEEALDVVELRMPYRGDEGGGPEQMTRKVEVLPADDRSIDWSRFHRGINRLHEQCVGWCRREGGEPDMIAIGINRGGVTIADMLGGNDTWIMGIAYTASEGGKGRCLKRLALPKLERDPSEYKVLLVDMVMKTGSSLEVVKEGLVKNGFDSKNMRAAVLAFVSPGVTEAVKSGQRLVLSPDTFTRSVRQPPATYRAWLKRLCYTAFLSSHPITYPWDTWDGA
jgi:hypoxanthine phosphoribosyltransferase